MSSRRWCRAARVFARRSACAVLALLACAWPGHGQSRDLDALAQEAATAIEANTKDLKGRARVLVHGFYVTNPGLPYLELGGDLAESFDGALRKHDQGFSVVDRDDSISKKVTETGDETICRSGPVPPEVIVEGEFQIRPGDEMKLTVRALRDKKLIFEKTADLLPNADVLRRGEDPTEWAPVLQGRVAWVRSASDAASIGKPIRISSERDGSRGYKQPSCLHCPQPQFSGDAVKEKYQGTVLLDVEIDAQGQAIAINVVKALGCGLTPKAVDAVKDWRFAAATDPEGKPVVVLAPLKSPFGCIDTFI